MTPFLTRLRALDAAASKAPWSDDASDPSDVVVWGVRQNDDERMLMNVGGANPQQVGVAFDIDAANAALIVALRNAAPRIAALVEAAGAMESAEQQYRAEYQRHGAGSLNAGRAWDIMRVAGEKVRAALAALDKEVAL